MVARTDLAGRTRWILGDQLLGLIATQPRRIARVARPECGKWYPIRALPSQRGQFVARVGDWDWWVQMPLQHFLWLPEERPA